MLAIFLFLWELWQSFWQEVYALLKVKNSKMAILLAKLG
jgi:hypothetical protein